MTTTTSDAHLALALRLHRGFAPDTRRNACHSPLSVTAALGVSAEATAGSTRAELLDALGFSRLDELRAAVVASARAERAELAIANTVWAEERIELAGRFLERLAGWPNANARAAPFHTDPERARLLINDDVAETTRGLIEELVPPGAVETGTVAAIVNALYLKASWEHPFGEHATEPAAFAGVGEVPMMRLNNRLRYGETAQWQAVILPAGPEVEAAVLVPRGELAAAEPALTTSTLRTLVDEADEAPVELSLPRLHVRGGGSLRGVLAGMGVRRLFEPGAEFTPMTSADVLVSEVLHESVLRVDERGFTGAAATAMFVRLAMVTDSRRPHVVRADHPFLLLVRDRRTGLVHFLARIVDPGAPQGSASAR